MRKTDPQRLRQLRARRHAAKAGYLLEKVRNAALWRLLYAAAGPPYRPVVAGDREAVVRYLADRKRA